MSARSRAALYTALAATALLVSLATPARAAPASCALEDAFDGPLDAARWEPLRLFDARRDRIETERGALVLALDTLGTDDATVKLRGVRSRAALDAAGGLTVTARLDWNDPANGCYLTAGLALVPDGGGDDPRAAADALVFEYVGVPPGRNVRPSLWRRAASALRPLYTEGWPQPRREDRVGRYVREVEVALELSPSGEVVLREDGRELFRAGPEAAGGRLAGPLRLVLFVTGHSNYPERAVRFLAVRVEGGGP